MYKRKPIVYLVMTMTVITFLVTSISIYNLYRVSEKNNKTALKELLDSHVGFILATYKKHQDPEEVIRFFRQTELNYSGMGQTGEFKIARLNHDTMYYLLVHRFSQYYYPPPVPFKSDLAAPMREALSIEPG